MSAPGAALRHALKEWAVICKALADGRQALILRKGGIEEEGFRLEHTRFWLCPTYVHQQAAGIKPEALPLLQAAEADRPAPGILRWSHFAEATGAYQLHDIVGVLKLNPFHFWSEETVRSRFAYRRPGLFAIPLRVYRAEQSVEIPELPSYAGCKSWLTLDRELSIAKAQPVLADARYREFCRTLDGLLQPTGLA